MHAVVAPFCIYAQRGEYAAKREVRGCALNSHGNYIVDHGKSWKNHEIVFLNFCGNPVVSTLFCFAFQLSTTSTYTDVGWFDGGRSW